MSHLYQKLEDMCYQIILEEQKQYLINPKESLNLIKLMLVMQENQALFIEFLLNLVNTIHNLIKTLVAQEKKYFPN